QTVRQQVGDVIRQEPRTVPGHAGVLTVTGLVPSPGEKPPVPASQSPTPRDTRTAPASEADEVITPLFRHTRYLLTLHGRPPFRHGVAAARCHAHLLCVWPSPRHGQPELLARPVSLR